MIRLLSALTAFGCLLLLILSVAVLFGAESPSLRIEGAILPGHTAVFALDPVGAPFLAAIALLGLAAAVYAPAYLAAYRDEMPAAWVAAGLPVFVGSMAAAVSAADLLSFLLSYEAMSLVSFLLVLSEHRRTAARRAAVAYAVITHAGTALAVLGLLALAAPVDGLGWNALAVGARMYSPFARNVLFAALLVGFGVKAGLVPLHVWLPLAHPQAPSHVSALMSGVMVKVALYGLLRSILLLGAGPAWWGWALVAAGAASSVLGVLYALGEHDMKRLLAFHTVENVGIITMGLGLFSLGASGGDWSAASVGLAAALYHVVNHASFKGLLFLGAGAVQAACGTRDLEDLGGLRRRMPATAALFLLGSAAIAGLPPLNGFVSELLTFHALLAAAHGSGADAGARAGALLGVAALALTAGLAAACFVKAFGVAFLGAPRSDRARAACEAPRGMLAGGALLAAACLFLGLLPGVGAAALAHPVRAALGAFGADAAAGAADLVGPWGALRTPWGIYAPLGILAVLGAVGAGAAGLAAAAGGRLRVRIHGTWNCGAEHGPRMQYTAGSFAKPIRVIFRRVLVQRAEAEEAYVESPRFRRVLRYEEHVVPFWTERVYRPARDRLVALARVLRRFQAGPVNLYLGYLFAAVVVLLAAALW